MSLSSEENSLIDRMLRGDRAALARLITFAETRRDSLPHILKLLKVKRDARAYVVGLTGPPGAGKSTLTNRMIECYRKSSKRIGVIAIDPSSPFSGGAILGDRVRMQDHSMDDRVFIRSISSGGAHGGISRATKEIIKLYDAFGMDYVIIETVGVGQTELDVVELADTVVVVLVPEAGDSIQTMKAGLMEIADIFVVNKADRDGAKVLLAELIDTISTRAIDSDWKTPVMLTSAAQDQGVEVLMRSVEAHLEYQEERGSLERKREKRREEEFSQIVHELLEREISEKLKSEEFKKIYNSVKMGERDPYEAARKLVSKII